MIAFQYTSAEIGTITWVPSPQAQKTLSALPKKLLGQLEEFFEDGFTSLGTIFTAIALRKRPQDVEQLFQRVFDRFAAAPPPD